MIPVLQEQCCGGLGSPEIDLCLTTCLQISFVKTKVELYVSLY